MSVTYVELAVIMGCCVIPPPPFSTNTEDIGYVLRLINVKALANDVLAFACILFEKLYCVLPIVMYRLSVIESTGINDTLATTDGDVFRPPICAIAPPPFTILILVFGYT